MRVTGAVKAPAAPVSQHSELCLCSGAVLAVRLSLQLRRGSKPAYIWRVPTSASTEHLSWAKTLTSSCSELTPPGSPNKGAPSTQHQTANKNRSDRREIQLLVQTQVKKHISEQTDLGVFSAFSTSGDVAQKLSQMMAFTILKKTLLVKGEQTNISLGAMRFLLPDWEKKSSFYHHSCFCLSLNRQTERSASLQPRGWLTFLGSVNMSHPQTFMHKQSM